MPDKKNASYAASRDELPSWAVGICGVAAVASLLFTVLLFLNR
jgi:hypothetical protein